MSREEPPPAWYACPACGNELGITGTSRPTMFADGARGLAIQRYRYSLQCACGHAWQVDETARRERHGAPWTRSYAAVDAVGEDAP